MRIVILRDNQGRVKLVTDGSMEVEAAQYLDDGINRTPKPCVVCKDPKYTGMVYEVDAPLLCSQQSIVASLIRGEPK